MRNHPRDSKDQIVDVEYAIYGTPHHPEPDGPCEGGPDTTYPDTENLDMDNQGLRNRPQLNKDKSNPNKSKKIYQVRRDQILSYPPLKPPGVRTG